MEHIHNQIFLRGNLHAIPEFSHENHGKCFYRFLLEIPRLSGICDILPVIAEKQLLEGLQISDGAMLSISGQIRSHNVRADGKRHLMIFVFASSMSIEDGEPANDCILEGPVCRTPVYRKTPLGREICDVMLAVPRTFQRADYLPCIFWGKTARQARECGVRDRIRVVGRLQSRNYTKVTDEGAVMKTAYEISALCAVFPDEADDMPCPGNQNM